MSESTANRTTHESSTDGAFGAGGLSRAGAGDRAGRLPARPLADLPQPGDPAVLAALAERMQANAAERTFDDDPFGLGDVQRVGESTDDQGSAQRVGSGASKPAPGRFAPASPERDAPRRLDDLERIVSKMRAAIPRLVTRAGAPELQDLAAQGRAVRDVLAAMERAGLLHAQGLDDRFSEARTHFDNIAAKLSAADAPATVESQSRSLDGRTGITLIDEGAYCERAVNSHDIACNLFPDDRRTVRLQLGDRVLAAHTNFVDAVSMEQFEQVAHKTQNWGFVAELLYGVASLAVGSGLMAVAKRLAAMPRPSLPGVDPSSMVTIEQMPMDGVNPETVLLGWKQVSSGVRNSIRTAVNGLADYERDGRVAFLQHLKDSSSAMRQSVSEEAPAVLNDQELVALHHAYDELHHRSTMYTALVKNLLARFETQKIGDIGKDVGDFDFGRREVVQLKYRGRLRRAMVAKDDHEPVDWAKRPPRFLSWVDSDFGEYADQVQRGRAGDVEVVEVDPWDPMRTSPKTPGAGGISDEVVTWMRNVSNEAR